MKSQDMSSEAFLSLLGTVVENNGERIKTKTQVDLRRFYEVLSGEPTVIPEGWEPFEDDAYDQLLGGSSAFMANIAKEARKRFLAR